MPLGAKRLVHPLGHLELRPAMLVTRGHALFEQPARAENFRDGGSGVRNLCGLQGSRHDSAREITIPRGILP